jgi:hypothetical protein
MAAKKKLSELKQTDGKVETFRPTTLEQVWGESGRSKYGTDSLEEYESTLKGMNKSDLHAHARKLGFRPDDNYDLLRRKLKQEFITHTNGFKAPLAPPKPPTKISPAVAKILAEGR